MTGRGEAWLSEGMSFVVEEKCPFCGQNLDGLSLFAAYRSQFSVSYAQLKADITMLRMAVERGFGDKSSSLLDAQLSTNASLLDFWSRYCNIEQNELRVPKHTAAAINAARDTILVILDRKAQAPLESIDILNEVAFLECLAFLNSVQAEVVAMNAAIRAMNAVITSRKAEIAGGSLAAAEAVMKRFLAVRKRHEPKIAEICVEYSKIEAEKANLEAQKAATRAKLEAHVTNVVRPYEKRINMLLDDFNAGFSIAETRHTYPGGQASSSYQLVINNTTVDIGDSRTDLAKPSFKNTLSAGDRTTLALAFFLADLERDPDRSNSIVVFDDPFNSQDAFRRLQTAYEIKKTGEQCAQVFVLSHDAGFLRQVWEKCPTDHRVAIQITNHRALGSKIGLCKLDEACRGRVATEIDDLLHFLNTGTGKAHDVVKKMRIVLETHCRSAFPNLFEADDMLGEIVRKTRLGGLHHPLYSFLDDLDRINDYSRDYHHGNNPTSSDFCHIDDTEMVGFVRKTLRISNNLQA